MTNQDFYNTLKAEKERLMNESKQALNYCQIKHGEMSKAWHKEASRASMLADNYFDYIDEAIDKINELMSLYTD